ncbi:MAG: hypothetical protein ACREVR_13500 [Burkholderiales bacterium]
MLDAPRRAHQRHALGVPLLVLGAGALAILARRKGALTRINASPGGGNGG